MTQDQQPAPDLRAAVETLISRAEDAASCPYGGHLSGCDHAPDIAKAATELRAALSGTASSPDPDLLRIAFANACADGYELSPSLWTMVAAEYDRLSSTADSDDG